MGRHRLTGLDADYISLGIYQGSAPVQGKELAKRGVEVLVLCAAEHQPAVYHFPGIEVVRAPLDDHKDPMTKQEMEMVNRIGWLVAMRVIDDSPVLITCMAGWNRSGIITASALCQLGLTPRSAVSLVRARRRNALCNESFVSHLPRILKA